MNERCLFVASAAVGNCHFCVFNMDLGQSHFAVASRRSVVSHFYVNHHASLYVNHHASRKIRFFLIFEGLQRRALGSNHSYLVNCGLAKKQPVPKSRRLPEVVLAPLLPLIFLRKAFTTSPDFLAAH